MRPCLLAALLLVTGASAAPTVLASPSALNIDVPNGFLPSDAIVPVNVTLVIQDFMCHEPRTFSVSLWSNTTEGVKATFALSTLVFTTDAHAYFADEYRRTQTVNLTVRALQSGQAELTASFPAHEIGPCLAPDGFQPSTTTVLVAVQGPAGSPPPPPPPTTDANESTETNATNETPPSPTPPATPRGSSNGPSTCSPDGGCGFISDYEAPQESENDAPGLGLVGALAVLALAAVALRRKK